ncbi:RidA family protein [Amycolatopsis sp. TRM77291]
MPDMEFFRPTWEWDSDIPLTQMVKCGDFLWLSGQTAFDERGEIVGRGDLPAQARQIFTNMQHVLGLAGCDLTSVVRLTNYFAAPLDDIALAKEYWKVRHEFFGDHRPASTGMQVAALMTPEMLLEVDAIAYAPGVKL